jgi:hypothetical protein
MIHKDLECLRADFRDLAIPAVKEMREDEEIVKAKYGILILESWRELMVQMAYVVRSRIKARPEDGCTDLEWVRRFFVRAGLNWAPSAEENLKPSTWTLDSKHIDRLAFDAAPSLDGVNPDWNAPDWVWERMAVIAEKHGIAAGRRFPGRKQDSPHFEARGA